MRGIPRRRLSAGAAAIVAAGLLLGVALVAAVLVGGQPLGSGENARRPAPPAVVPAERRVAWPAPESENPSAPASLTATVEQEPLAAAAASAFVEGAIDLPPEDRELWVRAYTAPVDRPRVSSALSSWARRLNDGDELTDGDRDSHLRVRTLGHRTRTSPTGDDPALVRVVLWQSAARERLADGNDTAPPPRHDYALTFVTLRPSGGTYLVASIDAVLPGPSPGPGAAAAYPPLDGPVAPVSEAGP